MSLSVPVTLLFTPEQVLIRGFRYMSGLKKITNQEYNKRNVRTFMAHYGSSPSVVAVVWCDIITEEIDLGVSAKDKNEKGFRRLLGAMHFLWAYPKNAVILASAMGTNIRQCQGENLWKWVKALALLKALKIVWPEDEYNDPNRQIIIVSVDGVDFKCWEKSTPEFNIDKGQYSHKFHHGALKYEIAIDTYTSRVVWINGPFRGGEHDKNIYDMALRDKIPNGKKIVCDRVYGKAADKAEYKKLCLPNLCDSKELGNFKARVRCRHESFNGRLKFFRSLADTYHHDNKKHVFVFEAICVIVQYQMENGSPLFSA